MNKKIFLYLAIFGSISVQAQERWSLRQCIDYAIEHNISIRQTANAAVPEHIQIAEVLVMPANQATGTIVSRK